MTKPKHCANNEHTFNATDPVNVFGTEYNAAEISTDGCRIKVICETCGLKAWENYQLVDITTERGRVIKTFNF